MADLKCPFGLWNLLLQKRILIGKQHEDGRLNCGEVPTDAACIEVDCLAISARVLQILVYLEKGTLYSTVRVSLLVSTHEKHLALIMFSVVSQ